MRLRPPISRGEVSVDGLVIALGFTCEHFGLQLADTMPLHRHSLILLVAVTAVSLRAQEPVDQLGVIEHYRGLSRAKCDLTTAELARSQNHFAGVERLLSGGHASHQEWLHARLTLLQREVEHRAAVTHDEFIDRLAGELHSDPAVRCRAAIRIASLAGDARTRVLSVVPVPIGQLDLRRLTEAERTFRSQVYQRIDSEVQYHEQRRHRLASAHPSNPDEPDVAYRSVLAQKRINHFEDQGVLISQFAPFVFEDQSIASPADVARVIDAHAESIHWKAVADIAAAQLPLVADWESRIAAAARQNAAPVSEWPTARAFTRRTKDRQRLALAHLARTHGSRRAAAARLVSLSPSIPPSTPTVDPKLACSAVIDRLIESSEEVESLGRNFRRVTARADQLSQLASLNADFTRESEYLQLKADLAEAAWADARFRHELRIWELDFAESIDDPSSHLNLLIRREQLIARSKTGETFAAAELAVAQFRVDELERLHDAGHASWQELTVARVRRDSARHQIIRAKATADRARVFADVLRESSRPSLSTQQVVLASPPSP